MNQGYHHRDNRDTRDHQGGARNSSNPHNRRHHRPHSREASNGPHYHNRYQNDRRGHHRQQNHRRDSHHHQSRSHQPPQPRGVVNVASNLFRLQNNGKIFEYAFEVNWAGEEQGNEDNGSQATPLDLLAENRDALFTKIEETHKKRFLTKLINFNSKLFFSISFMPKFEIELQITLTDTPTAEPTPKTLKIQFECIGELSSKKAYFTSIINSIISKSKLVDLDGWLFNPFELNSLSAELSMQPVFKCSVETLFNDHKISVINKILFCPQKSLYAIVMDLLAKKLEEGTIKRLLEGSLIKLNYPAWFKYFKITKFLTQVNLEEYQIEVDGGARRVSYLKYFQEKYPFVEIQHKNQFLIEGETVSERHRKRLRRRREVLIPELITVLLTQDRFSEIYSYDHYKKFNISKQLYKYFYGSKFLGNMLEKQSVKRVRDFWRLKIDPEAEIFNFRRLDYYPEYGVVSPQGAAKIQRGLLEEDRFFEKTILEHRMNHFTKLTNWAVFCSKDLMDETTEMLQSLTERSDHFKYVNSTPECFFVKSDDFGDWREGLKNQLSDKFEFILCFTKANKLKISKILVEFGLPFLVENLPYEPKIEPNNMHKIFQRIAAAKYDQPWALGQLVESQPTIFAAIRISTIEGCGTVLSFVFSRNKFFTKFFQKALILHNDQDLQNRIETFFGKCGALFRTKVANADFFTLCYLGNDENPENSDFYKKVKLVISEKFSALSSKGFCLIDVRRSHSVYVYPANHRSVANTRVMAYRSFKDFYESNNKLFKFSPQLLYMDLSQHAQIKFLLYSKYLKDQESRRGVVYEYECVKSENANLDLIRNWVLDRTILLSCVDFENLGRFCAVPAPLVYTISIEELLRTCEGGEDLEELGGLLKLVNNFKYPLYIR